MSKGKFLVEAYKSFDTSKVYNFNDAVNIILKNKRTKINETIEISLNLGVDPRHADQMVRGTVNLPNGSGKKIKVAVFAKDKNAEDAKKEGADVIGTDDLVQKIQDGFLDFDRCISTPDMMPKVGKLGKVLGPRNLMPNPKLGSVTNDIAKAVEGAKAGEIEYKNNDTLVQAGIAKSNFSKEDLVTNIKFFVDSINKERPGGVKGEFIKKVSISPTMGPGINIDLNSVIN